MHFLKVYKNGSTGPTFSSFCTDSTFLFYFYQKKFQPTAFNSLPTKNFHFFSKMTRKKLFFGKKFHFSLKNVLMLRHTNFRVQQLPSYHKRQLTLKKNCKFCGGGVEDDDDCCGGKHNSSFRDTNLDLES